MAVNFSESKTKENLMRAFAGESQARNRYTFAAEQCRREGMQSIGGIFLYTADQELAHARRFYELLKPETGTTIFIDGSYPVDEPGSVQDLLQAAAHNENEEAVDVYPAFARIAKEEGFYEAASTFMQIAEIEAMHRCRFQKLAELLKDHTFFERCETGKWICTNCGHVHEGRQAPAVCPVCRHDRDISCLMNWRAMFLGSVIFQDQRRIKMQRLRCCRKFLTALSLPGAGMHRSVVKMTLLEH